MRLASSLICCRGCITAHHLLRLPSGQPHQVGFVAAFGQELVGEAVPLPVRVDTFDAGVSASPLHHLSDA